MNWKFLESRYALKEIAENIVLSVFLDFLTSLEGFPLAFGFGQDGYS